MNLDELHKYLRNTKTTKEGENLLIEVADETGLVATITPCYQPFGGTPVVIYYDPIASMYKMVNVFIDSSLIDELPNGIMDEIYRDLFEIALSTTTEFLCGCSVGARISYNENGYFTFGVGPFSFGRYYLHDETKNGIEWIGMEYGGQAYQTIEPTGMEWYREGSYGDPASNNYEPMLRALLPYIIEKHRKLEIKVSG